MEITGRLKEDLLNGRVVLFLGAGAGQAAGLPSAVGLANKMYEWAGSPTDLSDLAGDLPGLVARLDKNPSFTRRWVDQKLKDYFLDRSNYIELGMHSKLLSLKLKAIFTTNYDCCLEFAEQPGGGNRLVRVTDGRDHAAVFDDTPGRLQYFKIHGCARELDEHPGSAPPLVITRADFRESFRRNSLFFERLKGWVYTHSVVFIGFQGHKADADHLMSHLFEAYDHLSRTFHTPFKAFAVLPNLSNRDREELEDSGLTPLEGRFEDFITAACGLFEGPSPGPSGSPPGGGQHTITVGNRKFEISSAELEQYSPQFHILHDDLKEQERSALGEVSFARIADMWKAEPNDALLAANYYVTRDQFDEYKDKLAQLVMRVGQQRSTQVLWLTGRRGSGKSTLARQLLWHAYSQLGHPAIKLNPSASYFGNGSGKPTTEVSGWNEQLLDKFLSRFFSKMDGKNASEDHRKVVPIIMADHLAHRGAALDSLIHYLENHGKPCVLLIPISDEELGLAQDGADPTNPAIRNITRLKRLYGGDTLELRHLLSDKEIGLLFDVVARVEPRVVDNADRLIALASDPDGCNRDILLILYTWFDERFRRLDDIISNEIDYMQGVEGLRDLYLSTAVFHQYHFRPRLAVCAEAMDLSPDQVYSLREKPLFRALIDVSICNSDDPKRDLGATRHPMFSRRVAQRLLPTIDAQVALMTRVLGCCTTADTEFARGFLSHVYDYGTSFTQENVRSLKEATENYLKKDYVLNHQYAAYLIRENLDLGEARYYLDLALCESEANPAIIHSLGNLCFRQYREYLMADPAKAEASFADARQQFARSRALQRTDEEHAYYTEIAMLQFRLQNHIESAGTKATLDGERHALLLEALRVVPRERQNLLRGELGKERWFDELPKDEQEVLSESIAVGQASHLLVEYYGRSLLRQRVPGTRQKISQLLAIYWPKAKADIQLAVVLCHLAKQAFIKNADSRFALLQQFYESAVRYKEQNLNFALLSEYVRLLMVDGFILGRYQFLRTSIRDLIELFRHSKPRFLGDEFILPRPNYVFDEGKEEVLERMFLESSEEIWNNPRVADRFERFARLRSPDLDGQFFSIELDPVTGYFIKGLRKEVAGQTGNVSLNFAVRYSSDGFFATEFR